jgi:O-antigen ligase
LLYLAAAAAGGYGMLISGTRAAIAVPIVGMAMYTVLCKNWKVCVASGTGLVLGLFILMFTQIGDNNPLVHRMRTAFDRDDASMNVRLENQKAIKAYMKEAPFGIGVGLDWTNLSNKNKFYIVASTPPDSDLVNIWIHLGEVGLVVYLLLQGLTLAVGSYLLLFRIQSIEIRGPLVGMICGCGGILVASYANMVYFQYPNGPLIYTCLTLVFLGPYFDKQYIAAKAQKEIETKQNDIAEAN